MLLRVVHLNGWRLVVLIWLGCIIVVNILLLDNPILVIGRRWSIALRLLIRIHSVGFLRRSSQLVLVRGPLIVLHTLVCTSHLCSGLLLLVLFFGGVELLG